MFLSTRHYFQSSSIYRVCQPLKNKQIVSNLSKLNILQANRYNQQNFNNVYYYQNHWSKECIKRITRLHTAGSDFGGERWAGNMFLRELDVDLVLSGLRGNVGRGAGAVIVVNASQLSLWRTLDWQRQTSYIPAQTRFKNNRMCNWFIHSLQNLSLAISVLFNSVQVCTCSRQTLRKKGRAHCFGHGYSQADGRVSCWHVANIFTCFI